YLAPGFQPLCNRIALQGVHFVAQSLVQAVDFARQVEQGSKKTLSWADHLPAQRLMLNTGLMGKMAFQKSLGVTHSLAHSLSTVCDLHHGLANGVCIVATMEFNRDVSSERLVDLARMVGTEK